MVKQVKCRRMLWRRWALPGLAAIGTFLLTLPAIAQDTMRGAFGPGGGLAGNEIKLASYRHAINQARCADGARNFFHQSGSDNDPLTTFISHYNERLHRCFMETQTVIIIFGGGTAINRSLIDTAGREYANVTFIDRPAVKPYGMANDILCDITLASGEDIACDSVAAFDEYIKSRMH